MKGEGGTDGKRRPHAQVAPQAREAPLMAGLTWVMMAIAIWHFTVFLPDRFWGGIVGAFLFCILGALAFGFAIHAGDMPSRDDLSIIERARGDPGHAARAGPLLPDRRPAGEQGPAPGRLRVPRDVTTRPARAGDATRIAEIYNQGIEDRVATFETSHRTAAESSRGSRRVASVVRGGARRGGRRVRPRLAVLGPLRLRGRGGAGRLRRPLRPWGRRRPALLDALCDAAETAGLYKLTARILAENAASLALHRAAGFRAVGVQQRHGRLDGQWRDVVLVEKLLGPARPPPSCCRRRGRAR